MLGKMIEDPKCLEDGGSLRGMELLDMSTRLFENKTRKQVSGRLNELTGIFKDISGKIYEGYEIHMGISGNPDKKMDEPVIQNGNVYGTYIHSIFDKAEILKGVVNSLAEKKGISIGTGEVEDYARLKEREYDRLADTLRKSMDMEYIYSILREAAI